MDNAAEFKGEKAKVRAHKIRTMDHSLSIWIFLLKTNEDYYKMNYRMKVQVT